MTNNRREGHDHDHATITSSIFATQSGTNWTHVREIPKEDHFLIMGRLITTTKPLILYSKLLCFSLLYLFTTLFLALYTTLSHSKCFFRSSPLDPLQNSLFSYPSSYGEHKYAVPTSRSTCTSPVFFSGTHYLLVILSRLFISITPSRWSLFAKGSRVMNSDYLDVVNEIKSFRETNRPLRYVKGNADTFGGNLSTLTRFSYFNHQNHNTEVLCGFLKKFPVSDSGQLHINSIVRS